jgi:type I restriction enzyme S subunit
LTTLPKGWSEVALGDVCDVSSGGTPARSHPENFGGDVPWVKIGDMLQGRITATEECISREGLATSSAKLFPAGTVLLSIFATIGRTAILGIDAATNQAVAGIVPTTDSLDTSYLRRFLDSSAASLARTGRGVAQANINLSILRTHRVPLPPIEEQRRIAAVLDQADELRAKRRATLALLDTLTESIFLDMFGDPVTASRYELVDFLEVFTDRSAGQPKTPAKDFLASGRYPLVDQGQDLIGGYTDDPSALCSVPAPIVVFGDHTRALKFVDFRFGVGADGVKVLTVNDGFDPIFAFHAIKLVGVTAAGYSRHFKFLKEVKVPRPPLAVQQEFAGNIAQLDPVRAAHSAGGELFDNLFASLQQRAFRGEL